MDDFEAYVKTRGGRLIQLAYLLCGDADTARDLTQATLAHLYPRWRIVEASSDPDAYVRRALSNRYLSSRRRWYARHVFAQELPEQAVSDNAVHAIELRMSLIPMLAALPVMQRTVLVLRYFEDWPDVEIAAFLGCPSATVRSHAARALASLRLAVPAEGLQEVMS